MNIIGKTLRIAAVVVGILLALAMFSNELVTKVDPKTGRHYDLLDREIVSEGRYHRKLKKPESRIYDLFYCLGGSAVVLGLWHISSRLKRTHHAA